VKRPDGSASTVILDASNKTGLETDVSLAL